MFELGIGDSFYYWWSFIQKLKNNFTIMLYHRAEYGTNLREYGFEAAASSLNEAKLIEEQLSSSAYT
ncbi:hypothetical protein LC087_04330 [Bacillus carboniphilus]|uniref:HEPN domain-containing protein n=1 Tax=Bacillus carboniphilus TaxID=86663 RepID=A0ABY9K0J2_9BACI|nr:hypothetical protein [Bacillus carboniphilus]WLR43411.1 hypothetical protein LC087_04330 [Bacillus carboniphilus]